MTAPTGAGSNRRLLIIVGVGVALVALNFVLPKVLFKSDSSDPVVLPRAASPAVTPGTVPSGTKPPPAETFEVFSMKNPFTPVVPGAGGIDTGSPSSTTTPPVVFPPSGGSTTTTSTLPGTNHGTSTTTTTQPSTEPRSSQQVEMLELFTDTDGRVVTQVRVDDLVSKVGEGDQFSTSYEVVSLSLASQCGTFLFGDDRFNLCVGQEVLK